MPRFASCLSVLRMRMDVEESRPLVGSSRNMSDGFVMSSYPIETLFRSPPEMPLRKTPPISWSQQACSDRRLMTSFTHLRVSASSLYSRILDAKVNSSLVVSVSPKMSSYYTNAATLPKSPKFNGRPFTNTLPPACAPPAVEWRWLNTLSKDVLPAPEGPMIATSSVGFRYPF